MNILLLPVSKVCFRSCAFALIAAAAMLGAVCSQGANPLVSLEYKIQGTFLQVEPIALAVPKGIPGSVMVSILSGGTTNSETSSQMAEGAYIQATLRGPGLPEPRRIISSPNGPLILPMLNLSGDYQLDNIALIDSETGKTRMEAMPSSVPVRVFEELLISTVTSRPLTMDEIQQKGIAIDESNFRAVEFNVAFVLDGKTIPISFPVISPQFKDSVELIPQAEVEERLKQAAALNQRISSEIVKLPPELQTAGLNLQIQGINFQPVDDSGPQNLTLRIPPIPALMVIPGNIGYLHQFFSVRIFTENGAPQGSRLSVDNVLAELKLPAGPDGLVSTNYAQPGDDPLRFARVGPNKEIRAALPVVSPGPDGEFGTSDDVPVLQPHETGQAEFLVEGLQQGLWVMDLDLSATLLGLAAGPVKVKGKAAGSVLVRNPSFSITFSHPRTVRAGEPYNASVTILNTGITPANLVHVTLNRNSLSGAVLAPGQPETVELKTILPGRTATATYRMIAQRTGQILFSDLTTGDDSVAGRFRLELGVDSRGVPLSPDTIAMPDFVNYLPSNVVAAATRVLGQALSISTAPQLPPGIGRVDNATITRRVLELAEAGQRLRYGDPLERVLSDLMRDWQGGRVPSDGFDEILRASDAGDDWTTGVFAALEADHGDATRRALNRAADWAGLGQQFILASTGPGNLWVEIPGGTNNATAQGSTQPYTLVYAGTNGSWAVSPHSTNELFVWSYTNGAPAADMAVFLVSTNGKTTQYTWNIDQPPDQAIYSFDPNQLPAMLMVDRDGDGKELAQLLPTALVVNELAPSLIAVEQDLSVNAGRSGSPCGGPPYANYGTVVAVAFSKPVTQASAGATNAYIVEGNNGANSVQVQPSGRIALLNLREGISAIRPRKLTVAGVTDIRGNPLISAPVPIHSVFPDTSVPFTAGASVSGRVFRGDGSLAKGVPVTLTMYDQTVGAYSCEAWVRRVSQVLTDDGGNFDFDYVMSDIPYSVSASDTTGLSAEALKVIMQSTVGDKPDGQRLQQLLGDDPNAGSLLALLSASSLPQAIAVIEGLDRAVVRDFISSGSSREGQEVPLSLRFRGRATVLGQVVASDGVTGVSGAAVNLYPDASSRELGRGVLSDAAGRFAFAGVPLGVFSVQVDTSDRRSAMVVGVVTVPGQSTNMLIALSSQPVLYGTLRGQVLDSDNLTPAPNARVFVGRYDSGSQVVREVVQITDADGSGFWQATNVPIRSFDIVAVTFDGSRKGVRNSIAPTANAVTYANVTLQAATTVFGQVQFDDGRPATNALVAGGSGLVRTDTRGFFQLEGVPVGSSTISAGLEKNTAAGIDFTRLGTATANIIAGAANYVVVNLRPAGKIFGKVFDARGNPQPGIRVAIPAEGGFYWTDADSNGNYSFENLGLGQYTISAPANAVAPQLDVPKLTAQIRSGDEDQIMAAFKEAVTVFIGSEDPLITGAHANFRPSSWGYTRARLPFDGAVVNADIRFIPQGTVSGKVLNAQGVPIGAKLLLTGLGPTLSGEPGTTVRGEMTSDPATGEFSFYSALLAGPWTLQAASPFYPEVIRTNGFVTTVDPDAKGIVLQFPPPREVNGRIAGRIYNPDGSLAGGGVRVHIDISADYQILTDTNGFFDTQIAFPANRGYTVEAFDPSTGLRGRAGLGMTPGITNFVDVHLLSRNSAVQVIVARANGLPAANALVQLDHGTYPLEKPLTGTTDTNGVINFLGLWEGKYAVSAQFSEAATRLFARSGASVGPNEAKTVRLQLGATGVIEGQFVMQDLVTPVVGAVVSIGNLGFASTTTNGTFRFEGVPLGTYSLATSDPLTGGNATGSATISYNTQTQSVRLVEASLGSVSGYVLDSYTSAHLSGAKVNINFSDGVTPSRTVTTAPDGSFSFPGSPMGAFSVSVRYDVPGSVGLSINGTGSGFLSTISPAAKVDIQLQQLGVLPVLVLENGGMPAANVSVRLTGPSGTRFQDTSTNGIVYFANLLVPGSYSVQAISTVAGKTRSGTNVSHSISGRGTNSTLTVVLPGVGYVQGKVLGSDGVAPVDGAEITLRMQASLFSGSTVTALTKPDGTFFIADVAVGPFLVTAASGSLAASENGVIARGGETNNVTLHLGGSGTIRGRVVRADGSTPVGGKDVFIEFTSQSSNAGRSVYRTLADGTFRFEHVPVGAVKLSSAAPDFAGLLTISTGLQTNGQVVDLGALKYDEALPWVTDVAPLDTTIGVPTTNSVTLRFSEALDPLSVSTNGIFIRSASGPVAAKLNLLPDTNGTLRIVTVSPLVPLRSKTVYEVLVLSGSLPGPNGSILGVGPADLVGRPLAAPFIATFVTRDDVPPVLVSLFPTNGAIQIDPMAVPRLSFDKTLKPDGYSFQLFGPKGPVPGSASVGVNGQVLSFVPTDPLRPNAVYTLSVSNVFDLSANRAAREPYVATFNTLDTVGPQIASLVLSTNTPPVAGGKIQVIATLLGNEPTATVRFTQNLVSLGTDSASPFTAEATMPSAGNTVIRAIASDQYGNDGPLAELVLTPIQPKAPRIDFVLISPTNAPIASGTTLLLDVSAFGDAAITNLQVLLDGVVVSGPFATNTSTLRLEAFIPATATSTDEVRVLAIAQDELGLSSGQQELALRVFDATPPSLLVLSPTNNAVLPFGDSFRVTVVVSDNSTNAALRLMASGSLQHTQVLEVVFAPNTPATNEFTIPLLNAPVGGGPLTITLTATDAATNIARIQRTLFLPNTTGPSISALTADTNTPPLAGVLLPVEAELAGTSAAARVTFTQDGVAIGTVTNRPYRISVKLPNAGSTVIRAWATDANGLVGAIATLTINVGDNVLPTIEIVRVTPPSGPLPSGSEFELQIVAGGNSGSFDLQAHLTGVLNSVVQGAGRVLRVRGRVPATAIAGETVFVVADAKDGIGQAAPRQTLPLAIVDGTAPSITILSPPGSAQLTPGTNLHLSAVFSDNSSNITATLIMSGFLNVTQSVQLTVVPNRLVTNSFIVALPSVVSVGSVLTASLDVSDGSGNIGSADRSFWLPGSSVATIWNRQALGQRLQCLGGRSYAWPNNANWSQAAIFADVCGTGELILAQPSNWSTTNYPNSPDANVILTSAGNAPVWLDGSVVVGSLTILPDGDLSMASGTSLSTFNLNLAGDGTISTPQCCTTPLLHVTAGLITKTGGAGSFDLGRGLRLTATDTLIRADSGTLLLPGNDSSYINGTFAAGTNSTVILVPSGKTANFSGAFEGDGQGSVLHDAGTMRAGVGGASFNMPGGLFTWAGGAISGNTFTNLGEITVDASQGVVADSQVYNLGRFFTSPKGGVGFYSGASINNMLSGTVEIQEGNSLFVAQCCTPPQFNNYGTLLKTGTNEAAVKVNFNNLGGVVEVREGSLVLGNDGSSFNGYFLVSADSSVDVTGGTTPTWAGYWSGSGGGPVTLSRGTLRMSPSAVIDFPRDTFQWSGARIEGNLTNLGWMRVTGPEDKFLSGKLDNMGFMAHGQGRLLAGSGSLIRNHAHGLYDMQDDLSLVVGSCCSPVTFENLGTFTKSGGTNVGTVSVLFNNLGGKVRVQAGTLVLANTGSSSNGVFEVAAGAILDPAGGSSPRWSGRFTAQGNGPVAFSRGSIQAPNGVELAFPANGFHWAGGTLVGRITNSASLSVPASTSPYLDGTLLNKGDIFQSNNATLQMFAGAILENQQLYSFDGTNAILTYNCCQPPIFRNTGLLRKTGVGIASISSTLFMNQDGTIDVQAGTLSLANNGSSVDGKFNIASGAVLDITGGQSPSWAGRITASGGGVLALASGTLNTPKGLTLDCVPGVFQWTGGTISGNTINSNSVSISGAGDSLLFGTFTNIGNVVQTTSGRLAMASGSTFVNGPSGIYSLLTSSGISPYNCCTPPRFDNYGTLVKEGPESAIISVGMNNMGGSIQVSGGRLVLASGSASSVGGNIAVADGSVLDLTGGAQPAWAGVLRGVGAGHVEINSGVLRANGLGLDFAPGVLRFNGGELRGTATNLNELIWAGNGLASGQIYNKGLIRINEGVTAYLLSGAQLVNLEGAEILLTNGSGSAVYNCCTDPLLSNAGLIRKVGAGSASINFPVRQANGSLRLEAGSLSLARGYPQGPGNLTIVLSGTNSGEFGTLLIAGNAAVSGSLAVELSDRYSPAQGDQFQILSAGSISGKFTSAQLPSGMALDYRGGSIFLVATGAVSLIPPMVNRDPRTSTNVAGSVAVFNAAVEGSAPMQIRWLFNGTPLSDDDHIAGAQSAQLTIASVTSADVGDYQVSASNSLGLAVSKVASLVLTECTQVDGLVGLWSGNGTTKDLVGTNDGTLNGSFDVGLGGLAFKLDGTSQFVDLGSWNVGTNWSWSAWVNPSAVPSGRRTIAGGIASCMDWGITMQDGVYGMATKPTNACTATLSSGVAAVAGQWKLVVGTSDGRLGKIYIDGVFLGQIDLASDYQPSTAGLRIGGEVCCAGANFPGLIQDVALFNRALGANEIAAIYAQGPGKLCLQPKRQAKTALPKFSASISAASSGQAGVMLVIESRLGDVYVIEHAESPTGPWTRVKEVTGTGGQMQVRLPVTSGRGFFRLARE